MTNLVKWIVPWLGAIILACCTSAYPMPATDPMPFLSPGVIEVSLEPVADSVGYDENGYLRLVITPAIDVDRLLMTIETSGVADYSGEPTLVVSGLVAGQIHQETIQMSASSDGEGDVFVSVSAFDSTGTSLCSMNDRVYIARDSYNMFLAAGGPLQVAVRRLYSQFSNGLMNDTVFQASLDSILGAGAIEDSRLEDGGNSITVSGRILWTDGTGGTHPARSVAVEIRDRELIGSELVTTVTTDMSGNYTATVDNNDGLLEGGRDLFVRVLTKSDGFVVRLPGLFGSTHRIESSVHGDMADHVTLTINLTANNTDDNNTAFSVCDAMVMIMDYIERTRGSLWGEVDVIFPSSGSFYDPLFNDINVERGDRFDWDVTHHETGHFVQDMLNIANSPGGQHTLGENLGERLGKDAGIRLAWGEGWPTFFAVTAQSIENAASMGIPNVGDFSYTETDEVTFTYSLETQLVFSSMGEDCELTVQRILWDIYDGNDDSGDQGVSIDDITLWNLIDGADPENLWEAYETIVAGRAVQQQANIGRIMSEHNVAPDPTAPADDADAIRTAIPTFQWEANGGGPSNRNNSFRIEFYNKEFTTRIFRSEELTTTDFTPTQLQWDEILRNSGSVINWVVLGEQTNSPATGPYMSGPRRLLQPVDVFFIVDLSGSFYDDLPIFKSQAPAIISELTASNPNTRFGLAKFEDYPIYPFGSASYGDKAYQKLVDLTDDYSLILGIIGGLYTRSGYDWPQSQLPALYQAATGAGQDLSEFGFPGAGIPSGQQANFRDGAKKLLIMWTDAPFHYPGDAGAISYPGPSLTETANAIKALDPPLVLGITSGGGGYSDLAAICNATGSVAPESGVDCDGNGIIDVVSGQPLVCGISASGVGIGEAIIALVEASKTTPENAPPVAICKNMTVEADISCTADASVDDGSYDPDGGPIVLEQDPPGPYPVGVTEVTLTVTDDFGLTDHCVAEVSVTGGTGYAVGKIVSDCPVSNTPLHGVEIDAYSDLGVLVGQGVTDTNGYYILSDLPANAVYNLVIIAPLGYTAAPNEIQVNIPCNDTITADFSLSCRFAAADPRTIGFWKHQFGVAAGGKGNAQIDGDSLCSYLNMIEEHFNSNSINQVVLYMSPSPDAVCLEKLFVARELLNLKGSVSMVARARQQLMALLLNVAAGYFHQTDIISKDSANVSQAITYCDNLIDDPEGNHELAKTIADIINNGQIVPGGVIPLATANIAYKTQSDLPEDYVLSQNYPNPFNPITEISFGLPNPSDVRLEVFNLLGQVVSIIHQGHLEAGHHSYSWDGSAVASGVYIYRLTAGEFVDSKKMILIK